MVGSDFFFLQRYQSLHSHFEGKGEEGNPEYVKKGILEQEWLHNSVDGVFLKTVGLGADLEFFFFLASLVVARRGLGCC